METGFTNIILPSITFFIFFYLAFNIIELLVILFLNRLIFKHWVFFVDKVMYAKVYYGNTIERISSVVMIIIIGALLKFSALIEILQFTSSGVQVMALLMIPAIFIIYFVTTKKIPQSNFLKRVHEHLFIYISAIVYIVVVILANHNYISFQSYINKQVAKPIIVSGSEILEASKKKKLLSKFRIMVANGECPRVNFVAKRSGTDVPSFIYIETDEGLSLDEGPIVHSDPDAYLVGRLCSSLEERFLLTDHGQWYWVFAE